MVGHAILPPPHVYVAQGTHCFHPTDGSGPFLSQLLHAAKLRPPGCSSPPMSGWKWNSQVGIPSHPTPPPLVFWGLLTRWGGGRTMSFVRVRQFGWTRIFLHFSVVFDLFPDCLYGMIFRSFCTLFLMALISIPYFPPFIFPPSLLHIFFVVPDFFVFPHLAPRRAIRNLSDGGLAGSVR